jgi:hypothetical protein
MVLEEDGSVGRPSCAQCRRSHMAITFHKIL